MDKQLLKESMDEGMKAYKQGQYGQAVSKLRQVLLEEPDNWNTRRYLAMAYYRSDCLLQAKAEFMYIVDACADNQLCLQAEQAVLLLNTQIDRRNRLGI